MKYLYMTLRLFFCPHKFRKTLRDGQYIDYLSDLAPDIKVIKGTFYDKECSYCGIVKRFGKRL